MAITLTGAGGLMTRLGHLIAAVNETVAYQGTTLPARTLTINDDYLATDQDLIDGLYSNLFSAQNSATGWPNNIRALAQATVQQMVTEAYPQPNNSYQTALAFLVNYLAENAQSVTRNTVSATAASTGGNTGNGNVIVGHNSSLGVPLEYMFPESISGTVVRDAQSGSAIAGMESISFAGQQAISNQLNWLFPGGSGASATLTAVSASANGGRGTANQLNNGSFETYITLANVPDKWHANIGTPGTTIKQSTAQFYDGLSSLQYVGNGSETTAIWSQFGVDFATSSGASPLTKYCVNLWLKCDVVPAAGVLSIELVNSSGVQLLNAAGNAAAFTVSLPGISTSWVAYAGFLDTPRILPSGGVYLRLRLSTAMSSGSSLFLDRCSLSAPNFLYAGGPPIVCASGNLNWISGDSFTLTVANARNGLLQSGLDRILNLRTASLILPSVVSSPSLSDALVT